MIQKNLKDHLNTQYLQLMHSTMDLKDILDQIHYIFYDTGHIFQLNQ